MAVDQLHAGMVGPPNDPSQPPGDDVARSPGLCLATVPSRVVLSKKTKGTVFLDRSTCLGEGRMLPGSELLLKSGRLIGTGREKLGSVERDNDPRRAFGERLREARLVAGLACKAGENR